MVLNAYKFTGSCFKYLKHGHKTWQWTVKHVHHKATTSKRKQSWQKEKRVQPSEKSTESGHLSRVLDSAASLEFTSTQASRSVLGVEISWKCGVFLSVLVRLEDDVRLVDLHENLCPAKTQVSCQVVPAKHLKLLRVLAFQNSFEVLRKSVLVQVGDNVLVFSLLRLTTHFVVLQNRIEDDVALPELAVDSQVEGSVSGSDLPLYGRSGWQIAGCLVCSSFLRRSSAVKLFQNIGQSRSRNSLHIDGDAFFSAKAFEDAPPEVSRLFGLLRYGRCNQRLLLGLGKIVKPMPTLNLFVCHDSRFCSVPRQERKTTLVI